MCSPMPFRDTLAPHMRLKIHQEWGDIGIVLGLLAKLWNLNIFYGWAADQCLSWVVSLLQELISTVIIPLSLFSIVLFSSFRLLSSPLLSLEFPLFTFDFSLFSFDFFCSLRLSFCVSVLPYALWSRVGQLHQGDCLLRVDVSFRIGGSVSHIFLCSSPSWHSSSGAVWCWYGYLCCLWHDPN